MIEQARRGLFRLAVSPAISAEVRRVLRDKFRWSEEAIAAALSDLEQCSTVVHPAQTLTVIQDDPDDDRVLECAMEAGSACIVSGDNHLLRLGGYGGIQIIKPVEFLRRLPML